MSTNFEQLKIELSAAALHLLLKARETAILSGDDQMVVDSKKGATILAVKTVTWTVREKDVLMIVKPTTTVAELEQVVAEAIGHTLDFLSELTSRLQATLSAPETEAERELYTS